MLVNGIDIRKYGAKQLTVDLQPPQISVNSEWVEGAPTPHEFDTEVQYGTCELTILFRGTSRNSIVRTLSEFLSLLTQRCRLNLDGYKGTYIGDLDSDSVKKTIVADRYILTVKFKGYMVDNEVTNVYRGVYGAKFTTLGTRDTPCIVEITPQANLQQLTIGGFGDDDIILTDLRAGHTVIINGERGTVTQDGENKFGDCDMWAFPVLKKDRENNITFSSDKCDVTIHYSPMWI